MRRFFRTYGYKIAACFALVLIGQAFIGRQAPHPYTLSYPAYYGNRFTIPTDNPLTVEGVALGRRLFYEKRLSANNTISCSNCHLQRLAFTDGRRFSIGFDGTPTKRNSMSLANSLWVRNFFWDGRAAGLETQAVTPLTDPHEMGQSLDSSAAKLRKPRLAWATATVISCSAAATMRPLSSWMLALMTLD